MQFQIPQFIEVEDKIAGPFTLKQLLYLIGGGAIALVSFLIFKLWLTMIIITVDALISLSLAFFKYNGQPLIKVMSSAFFFFWHPRLYLWKREINEKVIELPEEKFVLNKRRTLKDVAATMPSVKKLWMDMITTKNPIPKREKTTAVSQIAEKFNVFRRLTGEKEVARRIDYR